MTDPARGERFVSEDSVGNTLYKKDFWSKENLAIQPTPLSPGEVRANYK